jgi:stage V sporulation protein AB
MIWEYILMALIGFGGGAVISGAIFALIASTGVVTRMADKSHTAKHIRWYESAIILGGTWWNIFWVFSINIPMGADFGQGFIIIMSLCQGIFVGCLAVSLAEAINATAIFSRRVKLKMGLSFIVLSIAIGKVVGALVQFINNWAKL